MPNQGHWGIFRATVNLFNSLLVQVSTTAARDSVLGDTGRMHISTDDQKVSRDSGSAWVTIIDADPATGVAGLRTLGTGAQQASAGNHTH